MTPRSQGTNLIVMYHVNYISITTGHFPHDTNHLPAPKKSLFSLPTDTRSHLCLFTLTLPLQVLYAFDHKLLLNQLPLEDKFYVCEPSKYFVLRPGYQTMHESMSASLGICFGFLQLLTFASELKHVFLKSCRSIDYWNRSELKICSGEVLEEIHAWAGPLKAGRLKWKKQETPNWGD